MITQRKNKLWLLAVVALVAMATLSVFGVLLTSEMQLNQIQSNAIKTLDSQRGHYDSQQIVLKNTPLETIQLLADKYSATYRVSFDGSFATLTLPDGVSIDDVYSDKSNRKYLQNMSADLYAKTSEETSSEEEYVREPIAPDYNVTDTFYNRQGYLDYLNMSSVWSTTKGSGITVAVIDTGIDTDHPEFSGKISEYSYNATEDKIIKDYLVDGAYDYSLIEDQQGHGTAVAGTIAASMDGVGTVGVASGVTLLVIKAECDAQGRFTRTSDLVFGVYYAIERDVDVINMSFGMSSADNPFASATKLAVDSDIICVAATGNDGTSALTYPAADENVIGVGALAEDSWELADYSNYGENVNIVAPGTVYTTAMGGGYDTINGTSFAAPIVAGAVALYLAQNKYSTFANVQEMLYASSYDLGSLGNDWYFGYGALDISALVLEQKGTVTFNMLTDELENTEQTFVRNHTLQNLPEPERLYAVFDGWYYDIECTEELNWYQDVWTSDLTLYANWVNEEDGVPYTYVTLPDDTIEIRSYTGKRRYITIPDEIEGKPVTSIGDFAFSGQNRLREVTLPQSLTNIGQSAFANCSNLVNIAIPDGVTTIGDNAFIGAVRLYDVTFGNNSQLQTVGQKAFAYTGITRFDIPQPVTTIDATAFLGATSLKNIVAHKNSQYFTSTNGV